MFKEPIFEKPKITTEKLKEIMEMTRKREQEIPEGSIGYEEINKWLKKENLESYLEGGSFEALINQQEQYYREFYGKGFKIERNRIYIEKERLPIIKQGLESNCVNFPLLITTPETLTKEEQNQTETEYVYHKLLEPLKKKGLKIWAETGTERWTGLTLDEWLKRVLNVSVDDFDSSKLTDENWQQELDRVIKEKTKSGEPKKQQANKLQIIFTDSRKDTPQDQTITNQEGKQIINQYSFNKMLQNKVKALTPEQWIVLASQLYQKDKTELARNTWDWLMAVIDHKDKNTNPPVSAASASSDSDGVGLNSFSASDDFGSGRWRVSL